MYPSPSLSFDQLDVAPPIATLRSLEAVGQTSTGPNNGDRRRPVHASGSRVEFDPITQNLLTEVEAVRAVQIFFDNCHSHAPLLDISLRSSRIEDEDHEDCHARDGGIITPMRSEGRPVAKRYQTDVISMRPPYNMVSSIAIREIPTAMSLTETTTPDHLHLRGASISFQQGPLNIKPILQSKSSSFGAEISGIDWSKAIAPEIVNQLVQLQNQYAVLIFRKTGLNNAGHIAFSQQLGEELEVNPFFHGMENDRLQEPLLWDVSNIELDGSLVKKDSRRWHHSLGNALWHTDSSYHQRRSKYSILLSHGQPVSGGCWTHFADTRRAYEDLPEDRKRELENLIVEHDLWHSRRLASPVVYGQPTAKELSQKPPAFHKLVQVAPDGRKTLYLAAHAKKIVGKSLEESQELIWELIRHCTQPKYVFAMEWLSGGDMVWWDNRQSMHRADPYTEHMSARDVRRTTIIDDGPLALGVQIDNLRADGP